MTELLDWVEKQALENIRFHIQTSEHLTKESNTTLTLLLAGIGGAVAYLTKLFDSQAEFWLVTAVGAFGVQLIVLAAILIWYCLRTDVMWPPTSEPLCLFQPSFTVDRLREVELENIQGRINQVVQRNNRVATWLDRVRFGAVAAPIVSAAAAVLCTVLARVG